MIILRIVCMILWGVLFVASFFIAPTPILYRLAIVVILMEMLNTVIRESGE